MINLKIIRVVVMTHRSRPDTIFMTPDVETAFPTMRFEPNLKMEAEAGYGVEWVRKTFGRDPDEIVRLG